MLTTHTQTTHPASRYPWLGPLLIALFVGSGLVWLVGVLGGPWLALRLMGAAGGCLTGALAASRRAWRLAGVLLLTGQVLAIVALLLFLLG